MSGIGKFRTALIIVKQDGTGGVRTELETYIAKYCDGDGIIAAHTRMVFVCDY